MNKRILWLGFALVIIAALAVGCSSEEPSVTPSPEAPTPTVAAPTPTVAAPTPTTAAPTPTTAAPTPTTAAPTPTTAAPTPAQTASGFLPDVPRISVQEVKTKLDAGANIVIVDGRPVGEYEDSHILGSISLPVVGFLEMEAPYTELDGYDEIVLYCT